MARTYRFTRVSITDEDGREYLTNGAGIADGDDARTIGVFWCKNLLRRPGLTSPGLTGGPSYVITATNPGGVHVVLGDMRCTYDGSVGGRSSWTYDAVCEFKARS